MFASDVHARESLFGGESLLVLLPRGVPTKGGELGTPGSRGSVPSKYDREMGMDCTRCEAASSRDRRVVALPLGREVTANSV